MSDGKPDATETETARGAAPARKGHFKRFWWAYLLALLLVATVIVVPVVLLVAVPKLAQERLNDAKLTIDGITVTKTQTDSLVMAINSTIEADDSVHATIDAFEGTMYLADVDPPLAFAQIEFPQTSSSAMQSVNVSQEIQISNLDAFTTFNKALLSKESVTVQVKGDTHIHVSGISRAYSATFDKTVTLKGLNNFNGLSISNPAISARGSTNNFNGTVHIPNPSVLTLEIGNTTFTNYFDGQVVGQTYINNLVLRPGNNTFSTTADIQQLPIINALTQEPFCELGGKLPFELQGKDVVNNGQVLPYFRDALAASNQSITIDLSEAAKKIGIPTECLKTSGN
ncbi:hypothetical protein SAMD00023353_0200200 [Rosellinia necatrix]|uniref:Uncharacterized protein n=1 Tax=Rosellinia necatrix TaxID=77044 RepID=A0A1S7UK26_ROSNE|nr:hypothetical protein SAMD00023353_0200200 [Rosellinia necatrix]